ncbi:MAG: DUF2812 domain-containing protein [Rikenellaceae bacterium]|nr:DUF2812 domain-containing protein [Rikenellaceae bacterium]
MKFQGEMKKVWRYYNIAEYEKEEQWINEMAKEGWQLTAIGFCRYIFRRGTPGEYIYKLDVVERTASDEVKESYFNFLTECGIRVVGEFKDWIYLQKRTADGPFDMKDDTYAKLRTVNKVYSFAVRTLCKLLKIFAGVVIICSLGQMLSSNYAIQELFGGIMGGCAISAIIVLAILWVPILRKLRRKVNQLIDEIGVIV